MRRTIFAIILVMVVVILLVVVRFLFYPGSYQPPAPEKLRYEDITVSAPVSPPYTEAYGKRAGTIVFDLVHDNEFVPWEISVLLSRVAALGFAFEYLEAIAAPEMGEHPDEQGVRAAESQKAQLERMKEKLRYADALAVFVPQEAFTAEEVELLKEFVGKGGKLLLIGDPTRPSEINSVSTEFGLIFETDYLYNIKQFDINYRNIFITEFTQADGITDDLGKIALYSAGSISSPDKGIAFTDENTRSSVIETRGKLSPFALTEGSKVLAISDLTFMREPFNAAWDNNQLISNIADWLTESQRTFILSDFPYFLEAKADIVYANPLIVDFGVKLNNFLVDKGKGLEVGQYEDVSSSSRDTVFMGFFKEAGQVASYLERGKISVSVETELKEPEELTEEEQTEEQPPTEAESEEAEQAGEEEVTITRIDIENIGQVYKEEGTSILYLDQSEGRDVLIILSDTEETMKDTVGILRNGEFRNWLISDNLVIYHAEKPEVEAPEE